MMNLGVTQKMVPIVLLLKDRPKVQNLNKIKNTYDVLEGDNVTDTMITDNLLLIKKVTWKDNVESNSATKKDEKDSIGQIRIESQ